ncbi:DUF3021 family protein [Bacillus sp. JJ1764]|uniref:DUF3021 family protein n=1 Tax=Bacillus sp. JJ1764 TaxID=3122964 RepID=UPI002FFDECB6
MGLSEFIKKTMQQFFIIFAAIIIILTILRQIYYPNLSFDLNSIYIIMAFSLIGSLTGCILYSPYNISENNMRIRIIIHFVALETILISLGAFFGIVKGAADILIFALQIAVVYLIVRLLSWRNDKKVADEINGKLRSFNQTGD